MDYSGSVVATGRGLIWRLITAFLWLGFFWLVVGLIWLLFTYPIILILVGAALAVAMYTTDTGPRTRPFTRKSKHSA